MSKSTILAFTILPIIELDRDFMAIYLYSKFEDDTSKTETCRVLTSKSWRTHGRRRMARYMISSADFVIAELIKRRLIQIRCQKLRFLYRRIRKCIKSRKHLPWCQKRTGIFYSFLYRARKPVSLVLVWRGKWPPDGHFGSDFAHYRTWPSFYAHIPIYQVWRWYAKNLDL